ncbi:hypothetical protein JB92DRAFT_2273196 [Gautieria morchelliformis]|nr:hypothetical protein JB92DRAFT_2273196 [Gautieria morchelliformis]
MPPIPEGLSEPLRDFLTCCFNKDPAQRPNAEMLFEHPWLKSEWGLYKLRPQDSIPFLRRVSADFQRSDVRHLTFLEENGASSLRSSNGFSSTTEFPPRPHTFVKSTLGLAVTCEVCDQPVRKSAVRCAECSLIAHSKCAAEAPQTCDLRSQVIRISQDKQREAVRQQIPPPNPVNNLSSSPPEFSSRPYFRKKSKTHGLVADVTESSEPIRLPSAFRYDDTNVTKPKIFSRPQNSNNDDRSRSRASVASKQESSSKHSTATGSHTSGIADAGARVRSVSMAESELHHDSRITDSSMASEPVMNAGDRTHPEPDAWPNKPHVISSNHFYSFYSFYSGLTSAGVHNSLQITYPASYSTNIIPMHPCYYYPVSVSCPVSSTVSSSALHTVTNTITCVYQRQLYVANSLGGTKGLEQGGKGRSAPPARLPRGKNFFDGRV